MLAVPNATAQSPAAASPAFIRVRTALVRYGLGRTKLYELIANGSVRAVKLGNATLIDVAAADDFFLRLPQVCAGPRA